MKRKKWLLPSLLTTSLLLAACGGKTTTTEPTDTDTNEQDQVNVMTTIYPLEDFTKKIGGEYVDVSSLYPPNVDAHTYEPSTKDIIALAESDLFIYTGVGVEGFADKVADTLKAEDVKILAAGQEISLIDVQHHDDAEEHSSHQDKHDDHSENESHNHHDGHELDAPQDDHSEHDEHPHDTDPHHEDEGHEDELGHIQIEEHHDEEEHDEDHAHAHNEEQDEHHHDHGNVDPHIWLDPILSIQLAENIKNELTELLPARAEEFEENFTALQAELEKLDEEFKTTISSFENKHLLVSHAAYGYWEHRYGIKQIAISGLSPTDEPSQRSLQRMIEEAKKHQIRYVIFDQNLSGNIAQIVQNEIGAKPLTLHNLETLTPENIQNGDDYFSLMRQNVETIKTALSD